MARMNILQRMKLNWYDDREARRAVESGEYSFTKTPNAILDLGAHKGFATTYFARRYPKIPIHAYEPNPRLYRTLVRRTRTFPNVACFNEVVAAQDGQISFPIAERSVSSSIFGNGPSITLPSVSLQTAIRRLEDRVPVSIKSDIEGAEFVAFHDLSGVQEIVGEVHPEKAGKTNAEFRTLLLSTFTNVSMGEGKSLFTAV